MSRSFRLVPPEPRPDALARPRLMRILVGRWDHRVATLVGGPGLGKTTALAQAIVENRMDPRGDDVWVGLEPYDVDAPRLGADVAAALAAAGADPRAPAPDGLEPGAIAEAVWQRAPAETCLLFDDVHLLAEGSAGAAWLADLVDRLPSNGHVVLAGRAEPPMRLSRLSAQAELLRLDEGALRFTDDELAWFAARRGLDPDLLDDTGGWPALAELTATVDRRFTGSYLWEEVLDPLGARRRRVLAVLSDLGGGDDGLVSAAAGAPVDLAEDVAGIPLVARDAAGWYVPHTLWRTAPEMALEPAERAEVRRRAVAHLAAQGRFDEAFSLVEEAGLWDVAPALLRSAGLASDRLTTSQLERWLAASPPAVRASTGGRLAHGILADFTSPSTATEPLEQAIEQCRAEGDVDGEMAAIVHQSKLAWSRQDQDLLGQLMGRVGELQTTGHPTARALATVAGAAIADLVGDDAQLLGLLDEIEPSALDRTWGTLVSFWTAQVRMGLGDTRPIHDLLDRLGPATDPALRGVASAVELSVLWAEGDIDAALERCPEMLAIIRTAGVQSHLYLALNGASLASARVGDLAAARRYLDESIAVALPTGADAPDAPDEDRPADSARTMMARANLQLAEGREADAAATLRQAIAVHGLAQGADRDTWRQHIPVTYVLLPETQEHWDGAPLRGHLLTARTLAQMLVALRAGRGGEVLPGFELPPPRVVRSALDSRWVTEVAVGLHDAGRRAEARTLLDVLGPVGRAALRDLAGGREPLRSRPAKALLAAAPAPPPEPAHLAVLGPLVLRRGDPDGPPVVDAHLRRNRIRALLAYLVGHRRTTRAAIMSTLWPDLPERAAANNLAVTVSHLLRLLEPWRDRGEPGYLLRVDSSSVQLVTGEHLQVDVDAFDRHLALAAAAEADGVPSLALEHDLAAVGLYRHELHADLPEADWFALEREHYRTRFVGAATRAAQLLLSRGDIDEAEGVAHRALTVDQWSEDAYAVLVGAALARRDRSGAHRMLTRCLDVLADLDVPPSRSTRQLQRRVLGLTA